ncbi:MAG: DUF3108 domain-containing protein [Xanthobacteraceae bacterium]|nr:DUF3108 domain-containing protein [Xanthobacteraceae bacterium]
MRRLAVSAAALLLLAASTPAAFAQTRLNAAYSVYLTGIPIGQGAIIVDLNEAGYAAAGSAKFTGLVRMISKGEGTSTVRGSFANNRVISSLYSMQSHSVDRDEKVDITVENGFAKEFSVLPPPKDLDINRVPITSAARTNVVDPLSAGLVLVAAPGDALSPESCNRTLPIFDARFRYDVVLSYARTEGAPKKVEGYTGPVLVCQARYVPIAGHRTDRPQVRELANNRNLFVWLAPVAGTRALVPIKVSIATPIGTMVVEATRFQTGPTPR